MKQTKAYLHGNGDLQKTLVVVFLRGGADGLAWFQRLAMKTITGNGPELRSVKKRQSVSTIGSASTR